MRKLSFLLTFIFALTNSIYAQYDEEYVEPYSVDLNGETYSVVKMSRRDNRVKVRYFAAKDFNGKKVYQRYSEWSRNKNIIAYSSGTYMNSCEAYNATPVGVCVDDGVIVNRLIEPNLDGLAIVYATGGMVASNLKEGNLSVTNSDGSKETLNLRNNFQLTKFFNWAKSVSATVFQTHLFVYNDQLKVYSNGSSSLRERRFLAVGKNSDGEVIHCLVNLSGQNTIYDASVKVKEFLKKREDIEITFLINLDTGCQDVFQVRNSRGQVNTDPGFMGGAPIENSTNLIVYYYE